MEDEGRQPPNPVSKAAASSNLPRQARARIGDTTDPVPEGKQVDAAPEHHFKVDPASHDVQRSHPTDPSEMGIVQRDSHMREMAKVHGGEDALNRKDVMDYNRASWQGTSTAANKRMDSHHRTNDFQATGRGHSKHLDTVTRGQPKQHGK